MAPDLDSVVLDGAYIAGDIKVEVDIVLDNLAQRLRDVNRKVS